MPCQNSIIFSSNWFLELIIRHMTYSGTARMKWFHSRKLRSAKSRSMPWDWSVGLSRSSTVASYPLAAPLDDFIVLGAEPGSPHQVSHQCNVVVCHPYSSSTKNEANIAGQIIAFSLPQVYPRIGGNIHWGSPSTPSLSAGAMGKRDPPSLAAGGLVAPVQVPAGTGTTNLAAGHYEGHRHGHDERHHCNGGGGGSEDEGEAAGIFPVVAG